MLRVSVVGKGNSERSLGFNAKGFHEVLKREFGLGVPSLSP